MRMHTLKIHDHAVHFKAVNGPGMLSIWFASFHQEKRFELIIKVFVPSHESDVYASTLHLLLI
jgi:hypothetical protein